MLNERNFGLKIVSSVFLLVLVCQTICVDNKADMSHSRIKRNNPYNNKDSYATPSYPGGPGYKDDCSQPICKTPPKCLPAAALPTKPSTSWVSFFRIFYVTVGSCYGYSLAARMFIGRDVDTGRELGEMCWTQIFSNGGPPEAYNDGYGQQFVQNFTTSDGITVPDSGTEFTDLTLLNVETDHAVLTDEKSYILYYRCLDGRYGDYFLLTTTPFIDKATATEVIVLIERMGFDISQVRFQSCQAPGYPSPFQDYLNSNCDSYSSIRPSTCSANSNPYVQPEHYHGGPSYNSNPPYNSHGNPY